MIVPAQGRSSMHVTVTSRNFQFLQVNIPVISRTHLFSAVVQLESPDSEFMTMVGVPLYLLVSLTALAHGIPQQNTCLLACRRLTAADAHSHSLYNIPLHIIVLSAI